nr:ubiquitin protein atg12 [Hymenolepis microstoma]
MIMSTATSSTPQTEGARQSPKIDRNKIAISFRAAGGTRVLAKRKLAIERSETVTSLVNYFRRKLKMGPNENIFVFVNSSFTPSLDTDLGTIFDCFSADGTLFIQYCTTTAWGKSLLRDFLYPAISICLLHLKAYPNEAFKSARVFGTPVKILRVHSVRSYVVGILDSLQLSADGQQEIVLRYRCSDNEDHSDIVFRFLLTALSSDEDINADKWKEELGLVLGKLWIQPPTASASNNVSWALLVRNWFQSDPQFSFRDLFDTEMQTSLSRTCLPVYSMNRYGLNLQVLYIFPKLQRNGLKKEL